MRARIRDAELSFGVEGVGLAPDGFRRRFGLRPKPSGIAAPTPVISRAHDRGG